MARFLTSKFVVIGFLVLLFMIGLTMLSSLVRERQQYNEDVIQGIGKDYVNPQTILAPYIVVPTTLQVVCKEDIAKKCLIDYNILLTPQNSAWNHQLQVSNTNFKRGIYKAITYVDNLSVKGKFSLPEQLITPEQNQTIHWDKAKLRLSISDLRGLTNQPILTLGGQKLTFDFPTGDSSNPLGMTYTEVPIVLSAQNPHFDFSLDFSLNGMSSLAVIPVGKDMSMTMDANWAHPSFYGASLPQKNIQSNQFSAAWQNTYISNQNAEHLNACLNANDSNACDALKNAENSAFSVKLIEAVDNYTLSDRSIKYAMLFLLITFGTFFLFEVLKKLPIHPMQYTLVAAALGVFYLLLLSFSEHVGFALAYLGSSIACVFLISYYVYYVLKGIGRTLLLTAILSLMYGSMYLILQTEEMTMILGALLVFVLIAATMILTRHIDWYDINASSSASKIKPLSPSSLGN